VADAAGDSDAGPQLFLCPSCDDVIAADWDRACARCGHDFGDGLEIKEPASTRLELSPRLMIALAALLLGVAALGSYFYWLFAGRTP